MREQLSRTPAEYLRTSPVLSEGGSPLKSGPIIDYGFIPKPENRFSHERAKHTAGHELNHALIAMDHGIMPLSLSVIPEGNSLGRTVFAGEIGTETFKVIAGGGCVDTAFGKASGFGSAYSPGSDMFHIASLHAQYGGIDADETVKRASSSLAKVPENIRERASEIIASIGSISGSDIPKIIRIAELEVAHGIVSVAPHLEENLVEIQKQRSYQEAISGGKQTIVGISEHGQILTPVVVELSENTCPQCGKSSTHLPNCSFSDVTTSEEKKSELSHSGVIVDLTKDVPVAA